MVVNTLKISFCADHSWREGASESSGEGRTKGGEKRGGGRMLFFFFKVKSTLLIKEKKTEGEGFSLGISILLYICLQTLCILLCVVHIVVWYLVVYIKKWYMDNRQGQNM